MNIVYLEYDKKTKQVVEIHNDGLNIEDGYDYAISDRFEVGDEFKLTIWVNKVNDNNELISHTAIRNNPQAKRLLEENTELKNRLQATEQALMQMMMEGVM